MKERFEGAGRSLLVDALRRQEFTGGSVEIAAALADAGTLEEYRPGDKLITQGGSDNDVYLLVMGVVALIINGAEHYSRKAGQHVGEMAAIEPMQPRSATVLASETTVALKVPCAEFLQIAERYPQVWRPMVRELSRRLYQRNSTIMRPNESPKLFIISSSEAIAVARAIRDGLGHDVFSTVWNEGVFFAGGYTLEVLEKQVEESDFAVAIAEPDDIVESRGTRAPTLRDNVLFELGLFMGKLTRYRTILVHPKVKNLKLPSDLQGLTLISYESGDDATANDRLKDTCDKIRTIVQARGVRTFTPERSR